MQFTPGAWTKWALDANPDATDPDPQNIFHGTRTTAAYLCGKGEVDLTDSAPGEPRARGDGSWKWCGFGRVERMRTDPGVPGGGVGGLVGTGQGNRLGIGSDRVERWPYVRSGRTPWNR